MDDKNEEQLRLLKEIRADVRALREDLESLAAALEMQQAAAAAS